MPSEAKQRIVLGSVRIFVIAPVAVMFSIPLIYFFHSLVPFLVGIAASTYVAISGAVEVTRGVLAHRARRSLPEARIIE